MSISSDKGSQSGHDHSSGKCPVTGASAGAGPNPHAFCPPQEGDIRSVCPALNTLANHGYIRRDGKNLSASSVSSGLKACYGLSTPLAAFLAHVGFLLLGKPFQKITLHDVSRHNKVEHDASLVHHDTPEGQEYAPKAIDLALAERLVGDVEPTKYELGEGQEFLIDAEDVGRARVRREAECRPIGGVKQEVARGEMAIILLVWGRTSGPKTGAPVNWIKKWLMEERLPEGWKKDKVVGLRQVMKMSKAIKKAAGEIRQSQQEEGLKEKEKEKPAPVS